MRISDWSSDVCSSDLDDEGRVEDHRRRGIAALERRQIDEGLEGRARLAIRLRRPVELAHLEVVAAGHRQTAPGVRVERSEERRVGKEWGSECRCRWGPYP